jgi:hypothetical protein
VWTQVAPAQHNPTHAKLEGTAVRRLRDLDDGAFRGPDARSEDAVVEGRKPEAAESQARDGDAQPAEHQRGRP